MSSYYRPIGKLSPLISTLASGQSQGNGGTVIENSFLLVTVEVEINGVKYVSDSSYVSSIFMSAVMSMVDSFGYSKGLGSSQLPFLSLKAFSLLSDEFDTRLDVAFDSLSNLSISNFKMVGGSLFTTTLKGNGVIQTSGTVKSCAFDAATLDKAGAGRVMPALVAPKRRFTLPFPAPITFMPSDSWVYDPFNKRLVSIGRLYRGLYSGDLYYIDYDIETGIMGSEVIEKSGIIVSQYSCITGDGLNFMLALYKATQDTTSCATYIHYLDFNTLTPTRIWLSHPVPADPGAYWNEDLKLIVSTRAITAQYLDYDTNTVVERLFRGFTVDLEGNVTLDTGFNFNTPNPSLFGTESIIYTPSSNVYSNITDNVENIATSNFALDRRDFLGDVNGDILTVKLNDINSPTTMEFNAIRLTDTANVLCRLPEIEVNQGDTYTVTATLKMIDRRLN